MLKYYFQLVKKSPIETLGSNWSCFGKFQLGVHYGETKIKLVNLVGIF